MASSGVHSIPNRSANGANSSGPNEKPSVPPVMWTDIASPGRVAAEPMRERGGRRMEGRAAKAAGKENQRQHGLRGRQADEAEHRHREDWPGHHQDARTPRVREPAEPHLRHRRRNLVQHRQRACRGERQAESRDEQRQQRRVDVAVAVHHEVGAGHQQHRRMQPFTKARQRVPLAATTRRSTRAVASSSSAILSARAEAISTPTPAAMASHQPDREVDVDVLPA